MHGNGGGLLCAEVMAATTDMPRLTSTPTGGNNTYALRPASRECSHEGRLTKGAVAMTAPMDLLASTS